MRVNLDLLEIHSVSTFALLSYMHSVYLNVEVVRRATIWPSSLHHV